jgi:hypothetical protein
MGVILGDCMTVPSAKHLCFQHNSLTALGKIPIQLVLVCDVVGLRLSSAVTFSG